MMKNVSRSEFVEFLQKKLELGFIQNLPLEDPGRESVAMAKTIIRIDADEKEHV